MTGGGYGDRGDYYLREWAGGGRGGQQDFSSRDFGGGGGRAYGSADTYGRSDQRGGSHGYGNQGHGNQGFANRNYDNQGYRQGGGGYFQGGQGYGQHGGDYQGNQGYLQGQESFGQRQGGNFGQDPEYGRGGSGFSPMRTDRSQSFRGKGPKGYKRSDERLQEDISERLMDDDRIDASEVSVRCKDGVVTLEGSVSDRQVKHRIEDLVERCNGVKDIENRVTVQRTSQERPDADDEDSGDADRGQSASGGQKKKH
jgi:osmotically-inducible protein OsmY